MKTQKTVTLNKELFDIMLDNISRAEELMYKEMDNLESKYNINYMDNDLLIVRCQISNTKEMLESTQKRGAQKAYVNRWNSYRN